MAYIAPAGTDEIPTDFTSVASSVGDVAKGTMSSGNFAFLVDQDDLATLGQLQQ